MIENTGLLDSRSGPDNQIIDIHQIFSRYVYKYDENPEFVRRNHRKLPFHCDRVVILSRNHLTGFLDISAGIFRRNIDHAGLFAQ
ncbi:MAG: hypothetical protein EPN93_03655 [Spirochaetes bacterium]|nr:MAG: hypothetical protein EPN93_03655 [Spirochaetota bacterium]